MLFLVNKNSIYCAIRTIPHFFLKKLCLQKPSPTELEFFACPQLYTSFLESKLVFNSVYVRVGDWLNFELFQMHLEVWKEF